MRESPDLGKAGLQPKIRPVKRKINELFGDLANFIFTFANKAPNFTAFGEIGRHTFLFRKGDYRC